MPRPENFDVNDWYKMRKEHAFGAGVNFVTECDELTLNRPASADRPSIIYHYTDLTGAHAMIANQTLRFSERTHLNDPVEIQFGLDLAQKCTEYFARKDKWMAEILKALSGYFNSRVGSQYHMACFSTVQDDLPQWRTYADDGRGVCLGFDSGITAEIPTWVGAQVIPSEPFLMGYNTCHLIRAHHKVLRLALQTIKHAQEPLIVRYATLGDVVFDPFDEGEMRGLVSQMIEGLADHFIDTSFRYKHRAYAFEQEWRILIHLFKTKKLRVDGQRTRVRSGELVQYLDLPLQPGFQTSLKSIMIGPSAPNALVSQMERFLDSQGYPDLPVTKSRTPYRSVRSS